MKHNIVIGKPLIEAWKLISENENNFHKFDEQDTLFTDERYLPAILVDAGIVKSRSEVKRNRPDLCCTLNNVDCLWIKIGKQKIFIIVGE